jgi:hypothetical protein
MGCSGSSETNFEEEKILSSATETLGLSRHYASLIVKMFAEFSSYDNLDIKQFSQVYRRLKCPDLSLAKNIDNCVYSWCRLDEYTYSICRLSTLIVLTAHGSAVTKSRMLFTVHDKDCTGTISMKETEELLRNIEHVALVALVDYAKHHNSIADFGIMPDYVKKCRSVIKALSDELKELLFEGCAFVNTNKFITTLSTFDEGALLSASDFRQCLFRRWRAGRRTHSSEGAWKKLFSL